MGAYDYLIPGEKPKKPSTATAGKYDYLVPKKETQAFQAPEPENPIVSGLKIVGNDVKSVLTAPFPQQSFNPIEALKTGYHTVVDTLSNTFSRAKTASDTILNPNKSATEKVADYGKVVGGLVNSAFLPITAPLQAATRLPVVGSVAEAVNRFFGVLATAGADAAEGAVEALPISDRSKTAIIPLAKEIGALAAQIAAGKVGGEKVGLLKEKTTKIAEHIDKAVKLPEAVPPEVPKTIIPEATKIASTADVAPLQEGRAPNTRAIKLEQAAIEKKLTDGLGELPTHKKMNMADEAARALDFLNSRPDEALKIATGDTLPPSGVLPESIYTAAEIKAIREGDVPTLQKLANSTLPTISGQSLKALDSADPYSPVKIMRDIKAAREAAVEKKTGKNVAENTKEVVNQIKREVETHSSKRQSWESFIKEIQC